MPSQLRVAPRISVNKLGEYLVASAGRRRQIILDQKYPPDYQVIRYAQAERAIIEYMIEDRNDASILSKHVKRLTDWRPGRDDSAAKALRVRDCIDAITAFSAIARGDLPGDGLRLTAGPPDAPKLSKAGTSISVRPEIVSVGVGRNSTRTVGAIKLHFSKSHALDERAGEYVGVMLHEFAEHHLSDHGHPTYRQCHIIDVFARRVYSAPRAFVRRRADVAAACEEIADRWQSF